MKERLKTFLSLSLSFLLLTILPINVHAEVDGFQKIVDNVYIKTDIYNQLNNSPTTKMNLYKNSEEFKYENLITTVNDNYETSPYYSEEEMADTKNAGIIYYEAFNVDSNGSLFLNYDVFLDSMFIFYEKDVSRENYLAQTLDTFYKFISDGNDLRPLDNLSETSKISAIINDHLTSLGLENDGSLLYEIYLITEEMQENHEAYYNQMLKEEIEDLYGDLIQEENTKMQEEVDKDYKDVYLIFADREIDGYPFYKGQDIGNVDAGTHVMAEELTFLVEDEELVESSIASYYPIDLSNPTGEIEKNDKDALALIEAKFKNLIVEKPVYIVDVQTVYVPYPDDGDLKKLERKMEFQPMWQVTMLYEDKENETEEGEIPNFDFALFKVIDKKEVIK